MTHMSSSKREATLLDDLSGFEFEELMVDVFRHLGYKNVCRTARTGDVGRDIIMEEPPETGEPCVVIVECKHTENVSRPVVQKLHSAVTTYQFEGEKKGKIVTSGRFSNPAIEYAESVNQNAGREVIELIDGDDLRDIGEKIGLDLYSGKIEILCDETLPLPDNPDSIYSRVGEAFSDVKAFNKKYFSKPKFSIQFLPTLSVSAKIDATFKTSVGIIHQVNTRDNPIILAKRGTTNLEDPKVGGLVLDQMHLLRRYGVNLLEDPKVGGLVLDNLDHSITLDRDDFETHLPEAGEMEVLRFGMTETDYKESIIDLLRKKHEKTVTYKARKINRKYTKTCTPKKSDINILEIKPVYVPLVKTSTTIKDYTYSYEYLSACPEWTEYKDGIHQCVHCEDSGASTYTFCKDCGSVNCPDHTETERLEETPVCTDCAVTEKFFYKDKYFYNEENLEKFKRIYADMPFYDKAMENKPLAATILSILFMIILSVVTMFS